MDVIGAKHFTHTYSSNNCHTYRILDTLIDYIYQGRVYVGLRTTFVSCVIDQLHEFIS